MRRSTVVSRSSLELGKQGRLMQSFRSYLEGRFQFHFFCDLQQTGSLLGIRLVRQEEGDSMEPSMMHFCLQEGYRQVSGQIDFERDLRGRRGRCQARRKPFWKEHTICFGIV